MNPHGDHICNMKNKLLSQRLKRAYIELDGENYNTVHYQKNGNRYLKMIAPVLQLSKAAKILDIGGGFCYLTKFFKNQGYEISAIDFFYGDIPKIRCEKSGIPFYLLNVEVDDLPFEEEYFDVIMLGEVIEHFTYSPLTPLNKINKILKKGGVFILTTPSIFRIIGLLKMVSGYNFFHKLLSPNRENPFWYKGKEFIYRHNKLYSMKELRQLIVKSGFRIVSSGYVDEGICISGKPLKNILKIIFSPLLLIFPNFKDFIWVVAEKQE